MLRITRQTDYGIMLLAHIAEFPSGHWITARDAAQWSGLSLPMVSKILKSLARSHIITSHRGVAGGYSLAQSPAETSLADVIRALEGPISMVECGAHPGLCSQEPMCPVKINWWRINREVEQALERIPLSQMLAPRLPELLSLGSGPRQPNAGEQR